MKKMPWHRFVVACVLVFWGAGGARDAYAASHLMQPWSFADIDGWMGDDHASSYRVFLESCARNLPNPEREKVCEAARSAGMLRREAARRFFEESFQPCRITDGYGGSGGFFTSYYESLLDGSLTYDEAGGFVFPLYGVPENVVLASSLPEYPADLPAELEYVCRVEDNQYAPCPTREQIMRDGALAGQGLELAWVRDKVEAFFLHLQGSGQVALQDGRYLKVSFGAKNGHPYTAIGKVLSEWLEIPASEVTGDFLKTWMYTHPDRVDESMWRNESFVFFHARVEKGRSPMGPTGALGVPLTAQRSLAVDRSIHELGLPVWVDVVIPVYGDPGVHQTFRQLLVAADVGTAIKGPGRGDIFWGSGSAAGWQAGKIRQRGEFIVLLPRDGRGCGQ